MGLYLNSRTAYTLFRNEVEQPYFVDKTRMLEELFGFVKAGNKHICLTRPRRFGKTIAANMIAAFFQRVATQRKFLTGLRFPGRKNMTVSETVSMWFISRSMMCQGIFVPMRNILAE
ncbi:MAG: AAA family ATPase [Coprococcus sp.]|nr:AAA family ATPase [Coprococcus sp.]